MFGWSKKEKNEKKLNQARAELAKMSPKDRGKKLSRLRKRYPHRLGAGTYDFVDELFDYELVIMYLLLTDDMAVEEADLFDNPVEDVVEETIPLAEESAEPVVDEEPVAVTADVAEEAVTAETEGTSSFSSDTPVERTPEPTYTPEPDPTPSFDSDTTRSTYGGGDDSYSSGGSDSFDSGGCDCGGSDD